MIIRAEEPTDIPSIRAVHLAAFERHAEGRLVDTLRDANLVIASLVAVDDGRIVGHALFSAAWIDSTTESLPIASLAPVAVLPNEQRNGIGTALVRAGIEMCRTAHHPAVIVVGHPAYYPRFGFSATAVAHLSSPYAGGAFMGLDLRSGFLAAASGTIRYPPAFESV
jgi:putative acetyltransferase